MLEIDYFHVWLGKWSRDHAIQIEALLVRNLLVILSLNDAVRGCRCLMANSRIVLFCTNRVDRSLLLLAHTDYHR